jgi:hypothetical protein
MKTIARVLLLIAAICFAVPGCTLDVAPPPSPVADVDGGGALDHPTASSMSAESIKFTFEKIQ